MYFIGRHYVSGDPDFIEAEDKTTALFLSMQYGISVLGYTETYYEAIRWSTAEETSGIKFYLPDSEILEAKCECGAKHTSNPLYHLDYCPLCKIKL